MSDPLHPCDSSFGFLAKGNSCAAVYGLLWSKIGKMMHPCIYIQPWITKDLTCPGGWGDRQTRGWSWYWVYVFTMSGHFCSWVCIYAPEESVYPLSVVISQAWKSEPEDPQAQVGGLHLHTTKDTWCLADTTLLLHHSLWHVCEQCSLRGHQTCLSVPFLRLLLSACTFSTEFNKEIIILLLKKWRVLVIYACFYTWMLCLYDSMHRKVRNIKEKMT
jgi:hypothetical protein